MHGKFGYLKVTQLPCVICTVCEQSAFVCHDPRLPCVHYSLRVSFTLTLRSGSSPSPTIDPRFSLCEILKHTHLKFTVWPQASKQASTHARAQCSHASVGLAQARPNKLSSHHFMVQQLCNKYTLSHELACNITSYCTSGHSIFMS